ncbi:MAG: hypothetical protein LBP75_09145 [Planctomycetota bacterium]|jgi:hypothetical protein|nr:hypothetical protein [Planctomycetota bacterium]
MSKRLTHLWLPIVSLLVIALLTSTAVIYPQFFLAALSLPDAYFLPLLLSAATLSSGAFLLAVWLVAQPAWRVARNFRRLAAHSRATVTVEFMLVIPIVGVIFSTVFALAEISHAQIIFRYAAFSASRAGAVEDYSSNSHDWSDFLKMFSDMVNAFKNGGYDMPTNAQDRMRVAAAVALAGLDSRSFRRGDVNYAFDEDALAELLAEKKTSGGKILSGIWRRLGGAAGLYNWNPWQGRSGDEVFSDRLQTALTVFDDANPSLSETFRYTDADMGIIQELTHQLANVIKDAIKNLLTKAGEKKKNGGDGAVMGLIKTVLGKIVDADIIGTLVDKLLENTLDKFTGWLDKMVSDYTHIGYFLAPPVIENSMKFNLRLRPASLFWLIASWKNRDLDGNRYLTLTRTDERKDEKKEGGKLLPLRMMTSGHLIDKPMIPPLFFEVNFMLGDSSIFSPFKEESKPEEKPGPPTPPPSDPGRGI